VNEGIKNSAGRYIFILNQDVEVDGGCVARLAGRFREEGAPGRKPGAIVPMMKFFDLRGFVNGLGNHIRERSWGSDNFIGFVDVGQFRDLAEVPSACFGAVMLDRDAVADIGLLDEKYTAFCEDVDWSFRCWMRGWKIVPESRAVVYHKFGASYPQKGKLKLVARNRLRLVLKLFRGRKRWGFLRRYMGEDVRNFPSLVRRGEWGQAGAYIAAYGSLMIQIPGILLKRREFFAASPPLSLRESDILAKNPAVFSALDGEGRPILDARLIAGYYHPLLRKRRKRGHITYLSSKVDR
jgi:GT2 family glycosyltransferase